MNRSKVIMAAIGAAFLLSGFMVPKKSNKVKAPKGYKLVWADEFDQGTKPDEQNWIYEHGFVRNQELQWYQKDNARLEDGKLIIEGRREQIKNPNYQQGSKSWKTNREYAYYSSSCIKSRGKFSFQYGIMEVRAKIDTAMGMWPAIWTLGVSRPWPSNGEVDQLEYYRHNGEAKILANAAWLGKNKRVKWDSVKISYEEITAGDDGWTDRFHVWKMEWTEEYIRLFLDDKLLNEVDLSKTINPDGFNPFHQPQYILLNLAIGGNGGDPSNTSFPRKYEVDYVRVFQKK